MTAPQIRTKFASENMPFTCGFASLLNGATLTGTPTVTSEPDDLTITAASVSSVAITIGSQEQAIGQCVQCGISGGDTGQRYVLTVTATTSLGGTVSEECILEVE